jgi:hypothetical protein
LMYQFGEPEILKSPPSPRPRAVVIAHLPFDPNCKTILTRKT